MNWKTLATAGFFAVLNVAAFSAHADVSKASQTHLDIKKVISIVENGGSQCGIVNARMTYLDASGTQKVLDYSKFAECGNQGG
ncbi:hypothetical protein BK666_17560 [Pseudomonas frederiksbergensis]|uniref:DUF2790 domain-containing protein n=1 Tax=Pseudomonas frederiksbergensis TaxID=104087 RepID=A0A423K0L7_9PSED|nr:DUF2790 domain-containing protein [Pseudomonas frederiksbergensis]RON44171.1 hypothetical protein BK666_17560 [Pseudomonas frederiksbergensis]